MRYNAALIFFLSFVVAEARTVIVVPVSISTCFRFWVDLGQGIIREWNNMEQSIQGLINPIKSMPGPLNVKGVSPTHIRYVAFGDSYAAGSGSGGRALPVQSQDFDRCCYRNRNSYPSLLARQMLVSRFEFRACGGAVSIQGPNSVVHQMKSTKRDAQFVTVTVGGNDMGFAKIVTACLTSRFGKKRCYKALADAERLIINQLPQDISALDKRLRKQFPSAIVLFTGYPLPYSRHGSQLICIHSRSTQKKINAVVELLNTAIRRNVKNFVAISFEGHEMCVNDTFFIDHIRPSARTPLDCSFKRRNFARLGGFYHVTAKGQLEFSRTVIQWYFNRVGKN